MERAKGAERQSRKRNAGSRQSPAVRDLRKRRDVAAGKPATGWTPLASPGDARKRTRVIVIIMGVSGCGKTTVGRQLAVHLGWEFLDADDFHPPANIAKMRVGTPLSDADRVSWLALMRREVVERIAQGRSVVLACSALREAYRRELFHPGEPVRLVYLRGDFATIQQRLLQRTGHYMPATLLGSQFDTLEEPTEAIVVPVELSPADAVLEIERALNRVYSSHEGQATPPRPYGP